MEPTLILLTSAKGEIKLARISTSVCRKRYIVNGVEFLEAFPPGVITYIHDA